MGSRAEILGLTLEEFGRAISSWSLALAGTMLAIRRLEPTDSELEFVEVARKAREIDVTEAPMFEAKAANIERRMVRVRRAMLVQKWVLNGGRDECPRCERPWAEHAEACDLCGELRELVA